MLSSTRQEQQRGWKTRATQRGDTVGHGAGKASIDGEACAGHFSSGNQMLFFGGGFKGGYVHGKTAPRHPMVPVENPVSLSDAHATIYKTLGIPPDHNYVTEGRPFYVTNLGKGQPVDAMLA